MQGGVGTFMGCTSLTQAPKLPVSVENVSYVFMGCTSLTQAPVIPGNVKYMKSTFRGCTSLTDEVKINASPHPMNVVWCFYQTEQSIQITGNCSKETKQRLADTANNNNVWYDGMEEN